MKLDRATCYKAVAAHDRRFDGWFFVGVSSTGIYCRPVCAVRTPQFENCHFFPSAAAAEKSGFRPCLRCRPELAPGHGIFDAASRLAQAAALLIDDGFLNQACIPQLASRIGITERHLRRIFNAEFGVSPIEYAQTQRRLLAKRLLSDTALPVTEVALAAGFGSIRRFNSLFKQHYGFAPSRLRQRSTATVQSDTMTFELAYRPPFAWDALLDFLAARAIAPIECVDQRIYRRTLALTVGEQHYCGWLAVENSPRRHALKVTLPATLAGAVPQALGKIRRLFDLACRPDVIDRHLGPISQRLPGMRVPGTVDGFEIALRAIIGQQISVAGARCLLTRLVERFGEPLAAAPAGLTHLFPSAAALLAAPDNEIQAIGLTQARTATVMAVTQAVATGALRIEPLAPLDETVAALRSIRGIGDWTAQYIAMRGLGWPDAFPAGDLVLQRHFGLANAKALGIHAEQWAPWRAYAALHAWQQHQEETTAV
ncbi:AlkA N-terminal domain-containing protein [Pandoraea sp.]|uniref:AlkA N-terminal domain-containing protein n=1 Tax=Pandoraea sp. TaxID=1883445 RepID=UPI00121F827D|nr:AlkA N-terminal domain-containing protein [Pandoraea sp.]TAL55200.1 MAG: DNA-3-methyladenine glycosylase 2 family protein [Pandoraea sp.]TAM18834.1 MAG: DNA-3-methyladenine glycosylase 2 family protein [Pandoraea sp.]